MKTIGTDPSSPTTEIGNNGEVSQGFGLTKREYFAAKALQGFLSGSIDVIGHGVLDNYTAARYAVNLADALIEVLNKEA